MSYSELQLRDEEVDRTKIVYGASGGASATAANADEGDGDGEENVAAVRKVKPGQRVRSPPNNSKRTLALLNRSISRFTPQKSFGPSVQWA